MTLAFAIFASKSFTNLIILGTQLERSADLVTGNDPLVPWETGAGPNTQDSSNANCEKYDYLCPLSFFTKLE